MAKRNANSDPHAEMRQNTVFESGGIETYHAGHNDYQPGFLFSPRIPSQIPGSCKRPPKFVKVTVIFSLV